MAEYAGICVGGPYKGKRLVSPINTWQVALMSTPPVVLKEDEVGDPWVEIRRGRYKHSFGIWWWQGWDKKAKT
jgi:hypothetical protein